MTAIDASSPSHHRPAAEHGVAMLIALMAMTLMSALGTALIMATIVESKIVANFRRATESRYAADAAVERAVDELFRIADWNTILDGSTRSAFVDGSPLGIRLIADGRALNLAEVQNLANCQKVTTCSESDMQAITTERPWGLNNPEWQLFAYGPLNDILSTGTINSPYYVVVMVADDPSENDNDPLHDGASEANPGSGVLAVRAEAFGPRGSHSVIELTIARGSAGYNSGAGRAGSRILSWREVR